MSVTFEWGGARRAVVAAAVGLLVTSTSAYADGGKAAAIAEITRIEHQMATVQDAKSVSASWADDMVWIEIGPIEIHGGTPAKAMLAKQFELGGITDIRTKILRLDVHASGNRNGDMGYAVSTQNYMSKVAGGAELSFVFRETDVLEKRAGHWRIVHQHISIPVDLASGKALIGTADPIDDPRSVRGKPGVGK